MYLKNIYLEKKKFGPIKICIIVILGTGIGFDILLTVVTFNVHLISAIFCFKLFVIHDLQRPTNSFWSLLLIFRFIFNLLSSART